MLGSLAAGYFSKEWNSSVKIGGISINPFNHLTLHNVLVIDPKGDTVLVSKKIRCSFSRFPLNNGLSFRKVYLEDTKYNLEFTAEGMNLDFIIDYFKSDKPDDNKPPGKGFPIRVKTLSMRNVSFSLQMEDSANDTSTVGVNHRHMQFNGIYADIKNIVNIKDSVRATFVNFKTIEKSGLEVEQIAMEAVVSRRGITVKDAHIKTKNSNLFFDASLKYRDWKTMKYFIDSVQMDLTLKDSSYGNMLDAGYWAPILWGMDEKVDIKGQFNGTVADLHSEYFHLSFGKYSKVAGKASIKGLPKINNAIIKARIQHLTTTIDELNGIEFPESMLQIKIPDFLKNTGAIDLKADFEGTIRDFTALADIKSDVGDLHADLSMNYDQTIKDYVYKGVVKSNQLKFNDVINNEWIENIGLDVSFEGSGTSLKTLNSNVEGKWTNFDLRQNNYDSLSFSVKAEKGKFTGKLDLVDDDIRFNFLGLVDFSSFDNPEFKFTAGIKNANFAKLNLASLHDTSSSFLTRLRDSNVIFSAKINADFKGKDIDKINGKLVLSEIQYREQDKKSEIKNISIQATDTNNKRNLSINSDLFDFEMNGYFYFDNFIEILNRFMGDYFPQTFYKSSILRYVDNKEPQNFDFGLTIKNLQSVSDIFFPGISISSKTKLYGNYQDLDGFSLSISSDTLSFDNVVLHHLAMNSKQENDFYHINIKVDSVNVAQLFPLQNITTDINLKNDLIYLKLNWNDSLKSSLNNGDINLTLSPRTFDVGANFTNSHMTVNGEEWTIEPGNYLSYSETDMNISNLIFKAKDQSISINSEISKDGADELNIDFKDFQISQFNLLLDEIGLKSSGLINGSFQLKDFSKTPYFKSNLSINDLVVNDEKLGDASIISFLDNRNERLNVNLNITQKGNKGVYKPISIEGYIYPQRKNDNYDLSIGFQNFKLKTIAGYLESFASDFDGNLSGSLKIDGAFSVPKINGELSVNFGKIRIKMLNTAYNFADKIAIRENVFEIKDFSLTDSLANKATITGRILHNNFKDFNLDLGLQTGTFMFMNTEASYNSLYYGRIFASGNVKIKGPFENLSMNMDVRTQKGTNVSIPISNKAQLGQRQFIKFISKDPDSLLNRSHIFKQESSVGIKIDINLAATSNAKISVPLSFSQWGNGDLTATGDGDLKLVIDTKKGDFFMYGNYTIASGAFRLKFSDLLSKSFDLEKGGTINWSGNATDANIDVSGIYNLKASLKPLLGSTGSDQDMTKTIPVQSVINLKGKLMSPDIKFDIRLPRADQETEELVFSVIDKNNESQMLQQTIYLLLLSEFSPVSGGNGGSGGDAISSGVINTALGQAASILGGVIPFVDFGANYKPAETGGASETYGFSISKDADRWYFLLGADVEVNKTTSDAQNNNNFLAEFIIGYKITNNFSVRGFNLPNTSTLSKDNAPYIQGAGVVYQREFDRISELFKRRKKKVE